ncbi:hypothetical protein [Sorangium sp. So ce385]|uniref:hypothetical protein n=1 Tax=Sorangium sp. So ce385 TaxID=3133308 RepID=UPI003F5C4AB3
MVKRTTDVGLSGFLLVVLSVSVFACVGTVEEQEYDEQIGEVESELVYQAVATAAQATFDSYGERMTVVDTLGDGYSTVSEIRYWGLFCWASGGAGTRSYCNYDFPEGIGIEFRVCRAHRGEAFRDCSGWVWANTAD